METALEETRGDESANRSRCWGKSMRNEQERTEGTWGEVRTIGMWNRRAPNYSVMVLIVTVFTHRVLLKLYLHTVSPQFRRHGKTTTIIWITRQSILSMLRTNMLDHVLSLNSPEHTSACMERNIWTQWTPNWYVPTRYCNSSPVGISIQDLVEKRASRFHFDGFPKCDHNILVVRIVATTAGTTRHHCSNLNEYNIVCYNPVQR